jgi:hypothetical protein
LFAVIAASPLCVLPTKDAFEEFFLKKKIMSTKINAIVTFGIVTFSFLCALFIPGIGDAMTIAGCTTNPLVIILIFN